MHHESTNLAQRLIFSLWEREIGYQWGHCPIKPGPDGWPKKEKPEPAPLWIIYLALMCGWHLTFFTSFCEKIFWQEHLKGGRVCSSSLPQNSRDLGNVPLQLQRRSGKHRAVRHFLTSLHFLSHCFLAPFFSCFAHHLFIVGSSTNFRIKKNCERLGKLPLHLKILYVECVFNTYYGFSVVLFSLPCSCICSSCTPCFWWLISTVHFRIPGM